MVGNVLPCVIVKACGETLRCSVPLEQAVHVTEDVVMGQVPLDVGLTALCYGPGLFVVKLRPPDLLLYVTKVVRQRHIVHVRQ